jgi:hypothetical protein
MPQNTLFGVGKHLNLREVIIERKPLDRQAFFASLACEIQTVSLRYLGQEVEDCFIPSHRADTGRTDHS